MTTTTTTPMMTKAENRDPLRALVALGRALRDAGYSFTTVSPATHRRVEARAAAAGRAHAQSLRDVFGWSRAFAPSVLPPPLLELARVAGILRAGDEPGLCRSSVRFSTRGRDLFAHSAYPTLEANAVFFGPDTYRFCDLLEAELGAAGVEGGPLGRPACAVDIGCGSGAGGLVLARAYERVLLTDVNVRALELARVNAALAGATARVETIESDVLRSIAEPIDLVVANPPYMLDGGSRTYRDGGGRLGEGLAVRIARESLERLSPGGRLILYTGAPIVEGEDVFLAAVRDVCAEARAAWRYWEIDPDVFGEEIEENDAYAGVDRIAAVALVVTLPTRSGAHLATTSGR